MNAATADARPACQAAGLTGICAAGAGRDDPVLQRLEADVGGRGEDLQVRVGGLLPVQRRLADLLQEPLVVDGLHEQLVLGLGHPAARGQRAAHQGGLPADEFQRLGLVADPLALLEEQDRGVGVGQRAEGEREGRVDDVVVGLKRRQRLQGAGIDRSPDPGKLAELAEHRRDRRPGVRGFRAAGRGGGGTEGRDGGIGVHALGVQPGARHVAVHALPDEGQRALLRQLREQRLGGGADVLVDRVGVLLGDGAADRSAGGVGPQRDQRDHRDDQQDGERRPDRPLTALDTMTPAAHRRRRPARRAVLSRGDDPRLPCSSFPNHRASCRYRAKA